MFINTFKYGPERFVCTDERSLDQYLGVEIERLPDDSVFIMTQPFLIKHILEAANIDLRMTNSRPTPVIGPLLLIDEDGQDQNTIGSITLRHLKARHIHGYTSMHML